MILSILAFSNHVQMVPAERHFFGYLNYALHLFGETPKTTLAVLLLSESLSRLQIVGGVAIAAGIVLSRRATLVVVPQE